MNRFKLHPLLATAALALAAAPAGANEPSEYVPRAEYEQLRNEFAELKAQLAALAAQQSAATPAGVQPAAAPGATGEAAPTGGGGGSSGRTGIGLDLSNFQPGWERFRGPDWRWMDHTRYDEMNARIASGPGFELFAGMTSAGRFQYLQQDDVVVAGKQPTRLEPGFQTAWGSFEFLADFDQQLEVYFDVYLSTKAHANQLQGHEGYMLMRSLPGPLSEFPGLKQLMAIADIKAGQFDIDFGDHRYRRTDNARGQRNPFIGNTLLDPSSTEIGVEVISKPGTLNWLVGVGSGSETGTFETNRGMGVHGKAWLNLDQLRFAGSAYYLDHERGTTSFSNLYRASRSGGQYNGIFDNGNAPGAILVGVGKTLQAYQFDATWYTPKFELYGHLGWVNEQAPAGDEGWLYYTLDGVYRVTERLYLDARYNVAHADKLRGFESDGTVTRIQVGGGYWLFKPVLFKLEYVYESMSDFLAREGNVSGVEAWRGPSFHGAIAEFTFSY